jgi:SNF2 family DNA or RNA helicase
LSSEPKYARGDNVKVISSGKIGTINQVIKGSRSYSYKLTIDGVSRIFPENYVELFKDEEETIFEDFLSGNFGGFEDFQLFQTWYRLTRPLDNNLYSYLSSKTIFNPYQFKPLIKFLSANSYERLYIADEVGVGKTIESGIILTELFAREHLDHSTPILIVCPNSLGPKWKKEMKERFNLNFHIHNGESLKLTLKTTLDEGLFPQRYAHSIASIQLIRHQNYLPLLKELESNRFLPVFGIVIVDEAHHMRNSETDSNEVGTLLSSLTERMLMLSATPLNLRSEDLFNQMHILNPELFPDLTIFNTLQIPGRKLNRLRILLAGNIRENKQEIEEALSELKNDSIGSIISTHPVFELINTLVNQKPSLSITENVKIQNTLASLSPLYNSFTRTRKREALTHQVKRDAWHVPIELTTLELEFIEEFIDAIIQDYLRKSGDPIALGFITNIFRRMVSSSIPAMKSYLEWAIKSNKTILITDHNQFLEYEDDYRINESELSSLLLADFIKLNQKIDQMEEDSKYNQFKKLLEEILNSPEIPQVMIFAYFIRTLEYLQDRLIADGYKVGIIHGGIPLIGDQKTLGRYDVMDRFKQGQYDILLSSEVGGEGLDFQYCRAMINYDLPYNPMRIEQRIGRIDRFGQQADKIIIANLFIQGTVDEEIYERLFKRIRIVEDGVGAFEPIIGKEISEIQNQLLGGELSEAEKDQLSRRIEEAIEYAKSQMDIFDEHRRELINDSFIENPLNQFTKSSFISPIDAIQLTEKCLSYWSDCNLRTYRDNRGDLTLSPEIKTELEQFLRSPKHYAGYPELIPLLQDEKRLKVIFDGTMAIKYPDHVFLPPTGYWTRFLTSWLNNKEYIKKVFKFSTESSNTSLSQGEYVLFIFEIQIEGLKTEIEMIGIPVDFNTKQVIINNTDLVRELSSISSHAEVEENFNIDVYECLDLARERVSQLLETRINEITEQNTYNIEGRIAALKKSSKSRIINLQKRIDNHIKNKEAEGSLPEELYLRLTNARIDKESEKLEAKISQLHQKSEISIDYRLESIILLNIKE